MPRTRNIRKNKLLTTVDATSSVNLSMTGLPPLSPRSHLVSPTANPLPANLSMVGLPPLPFSPKASPMEMYSLPEVSTETVKIAPAELSMANLPPLSPAPLSIASSLSTVPLRPEARVHLPSVSVPTHKVWPQLTSDEHLEEMLSLPLYDIPTLEEVLSKTTQPALRKKLQRMIDEQRQYEGRGSATRGWSGTKPARGRPRHELMTQCGPACFLDPANEKFPICPKCEMGDGKCSCAMDCRGLTSAKVRAKQWGYESIAELADRLLKEKCGKSASPKSSPRLPRSPRNGRYFQY